MDKKTNLLARRLIDIKDELETITIDLFDNKYVTFGDEKKLMEAISNLSCLEFLDDSEPLVSDNSHFVLLKEAIYNLLARQSISYLAYTLNDLQEYLDSKSVNINLFDLSISEFYDCLLSVHYHKYVLPEISK